MTQKEIYDSLDSMLSNLKTRNFLNHLIRAYFPITNVDKVWEKPNGAFKCAITKDNLISVQEIINEIQTEDFKEQFINELKSQFTHDPKQENSISKLIGDKKLGLIGKETTTYMSYVALQEFYNWVLNKSLNGDKHINWLLSSMKELQKNVNVQKTKKENDITGSFTLGELDSFKKLKEKFNK